ncbi:MAG: 50S ribosomal protein L10 [Patescibacteria group bacterium]
MAITRERKEELLSKAKDILGNSATTVFVHAHGLSANDTSAMRTQMSQEGVGYTVIKKTLISKALEETKVSGTRPETEGELSLAYSDDLMAPARLVKEHAKKYKERVAIVGGIFDGVYKSQEEMLEIANIPDLQTLRGMFVNIINTPIQQLASGINAIAEKKEAMA